MASPSLSELAATTLDSRTGKLADNVTKNIALLYKLSGRGNIKTYSGGEYILQELDYASNSSVKKYKGYETLDLTAQNVITAAKYSPKHYSVSVQFSREDELANSGVEQKIDLVASRIKNAESSLKNAINEDLLTGDGTDSKAIDGLELQVPVNPATGTVGGIDRSSWSFWQSTVYDATTDGSAAASASNILTYINTVWMKITRNDDQPDLLVADNNYYGFLWGAMQAIQRIQSSDMAKAGFKSFEYAGADVILGGGIGSAMDANRLYLLNTKYLHFRPHKDQNFARLGGTRESVNQAASVVYLGFTGNLTSSGLKFQGLLKD